jgi:hypothetical protein
MLGAYLVVMPDVVGGAAWNLTGRWMQWYSGKPNAESAGVPGPRRGA